MLPTWKWVSSLSDKSPGRYIFQMLTDGRSVVLDWMSANTVRNIVSQHRNAKDAVCLLYFKNTYISLPVHLYCNKIFNSLISIPAPAFNIQNKSGCKWNWIWTDYGN